MAKKPKDLLVEADWSRGIVRDLPRTAMGEGSVYDAVDMLLNEPGLARKRGGTSYYGSAVSASVPIFLDVSSSAHAIDVHGDAHVESAEYKFGDASAAFDGSGDFISLDGSDDFLFGTGDFTIDFWLYINSAPSTTARLYDGRPTGGGITPTNMFREAFSSGSSYTTTLELTPTVNRLYLLTVTLPTNKTVTGVTGGGGLTWVKVTEKTQGTSQYVTVFRALETSGLTSGTVTVTLSGSISARAYVTIDEFDGVDTSGTSGSGAIVQSNTNGASSASSLTVSLSAFAASGNVSFGAFGIGNGATSLSVGSGFTSLTQQYGSGYGILTEYQAADSDPKANSTSSAPWAGIGIEISANPYPLVSLGSDSKVSFIGAAATLTTTTALSDATWYHVAVVRNSGTIDLYLDGTSEDSTSDSTDYQIGASRPAIGASGRTEGDQCLNGYMDEIRVSDSARWTTDFTAPTGEYSSDANTMLLLHCATTDNATAEKLALVMVAEFPSGTLLLASADDNHLYKFSGGSAVDLGSMTAIRRRPLCKPVLHVSGTSRAIFPATDGTSGPYAYDESTLSTLGGSPPAGKIAGIFKARLLLANSAANPNRIWFGPLDPTDTWDTTNAWVDFDHAITGLAAVRNALLVFSTGHTDYITGSIPPGTQGFDMSANPLGDVGCSDARTIDHWQDNIIFANQQGVYMTNGAAFRSLTEPPELGNLGIGAYWRSLLADYTSSWQISGGTLSDWYIITIRDDSDTLVETLACYLPRRSWMRLANFDAGMYASAAGVANELYYAARDAPNLVQVSGIFTPGSDNKNDANGTPVEPVLESRFIGSGPTLKAYGFARVSYDLRDAGADAPTLAVAIAPSAEATTYTDVTESPLAAVSDSTRKRFTLNKDAQGVNVRFTQSGPSAKTEILALEVEEHQYEAVVDGNQ